MFFAWNSGFANELKLTTNPDAVCNNGEQATYTIKKAKSKKWAIILPGGGVARNADEYKSRSEGMKSPELKPHYFGQAIEKDVEDKNYNMAVSYTHLRAHETCADLVCRLLLEKKKKQ